MSSQSIAFHAACKRCLQLHTGCAHAHSCNLWRLCCLTLTLLSSFKTKTWARWHRINIPAVQPLHASSHDAASRTLFEGRCQHKHVASSCLDTHYYCLVFFCTGLQLHKAALLLDLLAASLEGALDSRVIKLTNSQDNTVVSACSGNQRPSASAFRTTQSKFWLVPMCWLRA